MISAPKPRLVFRPRPTSNPKPRRLPKGKRVTIAVGFVSPDGIVIAADTKESYGSDDHTYVNKIGVDTHYISRPQLRPKTEAPYIALVGSGYGVLVDHIASHIKTIFHESADKELAVFRKALAELMPRLYTSKAFKSFPHSEATEMWTEFLVAVRPNYGENAALFHVNSSLVEEVYSGVRIIGCGTMQEMAFELAVLDLNRWDSEVAALYLVSEAKRRFSSVGGLTHVYSLPNPGPDAHPPKADKVLDQGYRDALFAQLRAWHHRLVVTVGSFSISEESSDAILKAFQEDVLRIRNEFIALEKMEGERTRLEMKRSARRQIEAEKKWEDSLKNTNPKP